jgi:heat shock protein HslJ/uncharacterized membrane protein
MTRIRPRIAAAILPITLAACTAGDAGPKSAGSPADDSVYLALGNDNGWVLEISPERINFIAGPDAAPLIFANPGGRPSFNGTRYVSGALTVDVTNTPCADGISKRRYADSVTVETAGKQYRGCGGTVLPPADLDGTNWRIAEIAGAATLKDAPATLSFARGQMSGTAGCNRLSGRFAADGVRLTVGAIMATRMACAPDRMAQETAVTTLLSKPMSMRNLDDGGLLLMAPGGVTMKLMPQR